MIDIQNKTSQLLREVAEICDENNITYFLGPRALSLATVFGGHSDYSINLDVLIPAGEIMKFIDAAIAKNRSDRAIDYMGNYKNHLGFRAEYVDKTTTFIQMGQGNDVSCYGAKILIIPLRRHLSGFNGTFHGAMETGWECNGYRFTKRLSIKRVISAGIVRVFMIIGKGNLAKLLFKKSMKANSYNELPEIVEIKRPKKKRKPYDSRYFAGNDQIIFDGTTYKTPLDYEEFLIDYYGEKWFERTENRKTNNIGKIVLDNMAYEDFLKISAERGESIPKLFKIKRRNLINGIFVVRAFQRRGKAIRIAKRSGDRLRFYEEFQSKRETILNLYARGDFENLKPIFEEHQARTVFYLRRGLGFCVSKEYFDIQCAIFKYDEKEELVEKLIRLVPEEHYKPII